MQSPPFCPSPGCSLHRPAAAAEAGSSWWCRAGHYRCRRAGWVQRFRCAGCGHRFSESSFAVKYYEKRSLSYPGLLGMLVNSAGVRAAARQLGVSPAAVSLRTAKLARQAIALQASAGEELPAAEPFVADGIESFWVSQYYPNHFNVLVGAHSQYIYALTTATIRRSGRMRPAQRSRRAALERRDSPEPAERYWRFEELLHQEAAPLWARMSPAERMLITDRDTRYPAALATVALSGITHQRVSSRAARTTHNPLFAVNYIDREIRKDLAEHRRETVCFARSAARSLQRAWLYAVYHNYLKPYRVGVGCRHTHAEQAGLPQATVQRSLRHWLTRRAFLSHLALSPPMLRAWLGAEHTPLRPDLINHRLTPRYALQ